MVYMGLKVRLEQLEKVLRQALAQPPQHQLTITRLFYDSPDPRTVVSSWVDPDDPMFVEHAM